LVEEQKARIERECPAQLDPLLQAVRERMHHLLTPGLDLEEIDDLLDLLPLPDLLLLPASPVGAAGQRPGLLVHVAADEEIVEDGHAAEQGDVLEGARDPKA